jgi:hypothetical protein
MTPEKLERINTWSAEALQALQGKMTVEELKKHGVIKLIHRKIWQDHSDEVSADPELAPFFEKIASEMAAESVSAAEDKPLTFGTCVAGIIAVFTAGSICSVLGASAAFEFPFYTYFEPVDYIRTAPIWGLVIATYLVTSALVIGIKYFTGQRVMLVSNKEFRSGQRSNTRFALMWLAVFAIGIVLYFFRQSTEYQGYLIVGSFFLASDHIFLRLRTERWYPDHWKGAKRAFLEVAPVTIGCAFLAGFFWLKPHVLESSQVRIQLKGDKNESEEGKIVYVLNKFVIASFLPSSGGKPYLRSVNLDEVSSIEELPPPKSTPTPSPSPKIQSPQNSSKT